MVSARCTDPQIMPRRTGGLVPASLQSIRTRRTASGQGILARARRNHWHTTPGKLWAALGFLVLAVLLASGVGFYAATDLNKTTDTIAEQLEPLNTDVTTLYRSLADADATVAAGYLTGGAESGRYDQDIAQAAASLAHAGPLASPDLVTGRRIEDLIAQLPVYAGLVEQARAVNRQDREAGVAALRRASGLMQSAILPEAAELQQRQADRLDEAYSRARTVPLGALVACGTCLAGLISVQVFLFRRTHRVFNIGLVAASGAVVAALAWWTVVGVVSSGLLSSSQAHSKSVSSALGPAQTAALQAQAVESLALVTHTGTGLDPDFDAQKILLERNQGAGGALGAAMQYASDPKGEALVRAAIDTANGYFATHDKVRQLEAAGKHTEAIDMAVRVDQSKRTRLDRLVEAIGHAAQYESAAFHRDIGDARQWLGSLRAGTAGLAVLALAGVVWGVQTRLGDYR
jgi:CHASE3 domain sensor protein